MRPALRYAYIFRRRITCSSRNWNFLKMVPSGTNSISVPLRSPAPLHLPRCFDFSSPFSKSASEYSPSRTART